MINFFYNLNPIIQSLIAGTFTFLITSLGSASVFFIKKQNNNLLKIFLSLSSGIMLSASIFSLLIPSIELAKIINIKIINVIIIGILGGSIFLFISNIYFENKNINKLNLYILSIILHNIPEGLSIGVAFGSLLYNIDNVTITSAICLSIGIGIQNFPEGSAISLPLYANKTSKIKSFIIGSLSGITEPISAVIGTILALKIKLILPYLLSFAAGAMLYVIINEIIPISQDTKNKNTMTLISIIGFIIMMILDIYLS